MIERLKDRFDRETTESDRKKLWLATRLMFGVKFDADLWEELTVGVINWEDSSTYQEIIRRGRNLGKEEGRLEGRVDEAQRLVVRLATKRFGPPEAEAEATIQAMTDIDQLDALVAKILDVNSWDELLTES